MLQCWITANLTIGLLGVEKFTAQSPLPSPISCKLLFPIIGLKISSLPTLELKYPKKLSCGTYRIDLLEILIPHRSCTPHHQFHPQSIPLIINFPPTKAQHMKQQFLKFSFT
jgi:hypothetical protein